jgi:hypothetical protein
MAILISGFTKNKYTKHGTKVPAIEPIILPSIVLLGDTFGINLCFPSNLPPIYANVSVNIVINTN